MKEIYVVTSGEYSDYGIFKIFENIDEVNDSDTWPRENPNLGHVASYETYQPNDDILAKRFGIPCFTKGEIYCTR